MKPIIFWGSSGHAKVLAEFMAEAGFELVATIDNDSTVPPLFPTVPIYYGEAGFKDWQNHRQLDKSCFGLVAIGGSRGSVRLELQRLFSTHGINCPVVIHPTAFVAKTAQLGAGSQVLAQAAVCADVIAGKACIINTAASADHECRLGDGVHLGPGATLSGCVEVGENSFIGAGAVVLPRIKIGANSIIGAGAVVTKDVPANKVMTGTPARFLRDNC